MNGELDLRMEALDDLEAPLTDREWGIAAGVSFGLAFVGTVVFLT